MELSSFAIMFIAIGMLTGGIRVCEKNYMFGIDNYLTKLSNKYNKEIDKTDYCRFEGMQKIKSATGLIILFMLYNLFNLNDFKTMIILWCGWGIIDTIIYSLKRKKFISKCPQKNML